MKGNVMIDIDNSGDGEAGGEVTYIGGRAVEQATEGETHEGTDHGDEIAAAKAAVKAALAEEGKRAAKEVKDHLDKDPVAKHRDADGKFASEDPVEKELDAAKAKLAKQPKPEEDDAEADGVALRKALQERKEAAKYKAEAQAEVEKARNEARQFYQQLQRERAELQQERQRLEVLKKDPIRAIKENGWDPEEFILDIANDGTPEGQAKRAQRELQQQIAELRQWKQEQADHAEQLKIQAAQQEKANFRRNVEQQFLNAAGAKNAEGKHVNAHLVSMYKDDPHALIVQADLVAERYRDATGNEASFAEIAEYLEERAARWYKNFSGAPKDGASVTQGKPPQGSATGRRSLGPSGSSERRSLGTSAADLDGDERREAAIDAVRAALVASGEKR